MRKKQFSERAHGIQENAFSPHKPSEKYDVMVET
jgi:hypothetical protein